MSPAATDLMRASRTLLGSLALAASLSSWAVPAASAEDFRAATPATKTGSAALAATPVYGESALIEAQMTLAALKSGLRSVAVKARTALPAAKADDDVIWIEDTAVPAKPIARPIAAQQPAKLPQASGTERPMLTPLHERLATSARTRIVRIAAEAEVTPVAEQKVTAIPATVISAEQPAPPRGTGSLSDAAYQPPKAGALIASESEPVPLALPSVPSPVPAAFPVTASQAMKPAAKPEPAPSEDNPLRDASRSSFGSVNPLR